MFERKTSSPVSKLYQIKFYKNKAKILMDGRQPRDVDPYKDLDYLFNYRFESD